MEKKWEELTREEKREFRMNRWVEAEGVEFASPEAKQLYKERATRLMKVYLLEEPDRVPVSLPAGYYPAYYAGGSMHKVMYDYDELRRAWIKFLHDFSSDMDTYRGPGLVHSGKVLEILDYKVNKWPGHGLSEKVSSYQFVEGEYMMADEYDELIRDPSDFVFRKLFPRQIGAFESFDKFSSFASVMGMPIRFISAAMNPDVRKGLQALIDAGAEMEKWQKAVNECSREGLAAGFPSGAGGMATAPFDTIGDALRGTQGVIMDMYRQPDKLHEAMDKIADITIENAIAGANASKGISVSFPLHKGDDVFMSDKQFEEFYWPSLKKVYMALIDEGLMVSSFAEGRYERRLDAISELPKGWTAWQFDQTDMANVKRVLGGIVCISGNVPSSLVATGTPQAVKDSCRKLIEICAPDGGYILTGGASVSETTPENLRAFMEAAKEYGTYKK
ncbi:uroporphyrinogen decarboxylase family protein [Chloroflexota bacterium]